MFHKAKSVHFFVLIVVLIALVGCGQNSSLESKKSSELYQGKIVIGTVLWPGYLALYLAEEKGYFKEAGLDVTIKDYPGLADLSKDYVTGKIQGRADLTFDAINERLDGFDHKVVLAIDYSSGADAILAGSELTSITDLRGKKVACELNTLEEFFMTWALLEDNLAPSEVTMLNATPEEAPKMLKAGQVDVAVSYEPFVSQLVSEGNFHILYSSKDAPGLISDILTFPTSFIEAYPETVQRIVDAYFRAMDFWKEHPSEVNIFLAKRLQDTPVGIARQLKGLTVLNQNDNHAAFTFSPGLKSLYGNMRRVGKFVRERRQKKFSELDTDKMIEAKFIRTFLNKKQPQPKQPDQQLEQK